MIKDVFLQMTGETLFTMIEGIILQIIGDIFLQNLGCIISKLGISLCRIEDIILQISRNIFLQNLGCIISKLGIFLWRIEDVFLQNGDGTVSREEFQEMCNNLSPEEVQIFFFLFSFYFSAVQDSSISDIVCPLVHWSLGPLEPTNNLKCD